MRKYKINKIKVIKLKRNSFNLKKKFKKKLYKKFWEKFSSGSVLKNSRSKLQEDIIKKWVLKIQNDFTLTMLPKIKSIDTILWYPFEIMKLLFETFFF